LGHTELDQAVVTKNTGHKHPAGYSVSEVMTKAISNHIGESQQVI